MAEKLFDINWVSETGSIANIKQGESISFNVSIEEKYSSYQPTGSFQVFIGESSGRINSVSINGKAVYFTVQNQYVQFPVLQQSSLIEIRRTPGVSYQLLNGSLPPGIALTTSGTIVGTLGHTPANQTIVYDFTIRGTVDGLVRDRSFRISSTGIDSPTEFGSDNVPTLVVDPTSRIAFFAIGSFSRAQHVFFSLDIQDQDEIIVPIDVIPVTGLPDNSGLFGGLPEGLMLDGTAITGLISSSAVSGRYLFSVRIGGAGSTTMQRFGIDVLNTMTSTIDIVPKIVWDIPSGSIGTLIVGEASYLAVHASPVYSPPVSYRLAPGSSPLPLGLEIDAASGNIIGRPTFVSKSGVAAFAIRANSGTLFSDRNFSIDIEAPFSSPNPYKIRMPLSAVDATAFYDADSSLIDAADLFQPSNPSFGRRLSPTVYLISSLDPAANIPAITQVDPSAIGTPGSYQRKRSVVLGGFSSAVARAANGDVVYEVVYRQIFDPQAGAGGFTLSETVPSPDKILYPQVKENVRYVYPNSIENARYDIVNKIGFASSDPSKRHSITVTGSELMPLWMRSEQILGDPSAIPGYVPAIVIGHFRPGTANRNIRRIIASEGYVPLGTVYNLGRYLVSNGLIDIEIIL